MAGEQGHASRVGNDRDPDVADVKVQQGEPLGIIPLLQSLPDTPFARLAKLACQVLATPWAVVCLLADDLLLLRSAATLPAWLQDEEQADTLRQLTQRVVEGAAPVAIAGWQPTSQAPGSVACLASPLWLAGRGIIGALCVLDHRSRAWTEAERSLLADLAAATASEVALHVERAARQAAESALTAERQRVALAMAAGSMALWDLDLASRRVTWSEAMPDLLQLGARWGYDRHDALLDLVLEEDLPLLQARRDAALARGEPGYEAEFRVRRGDGAVRWLQLKASIRRDAHGMPTSITGVAIDVSERKAAEERLRIALAAGHMGVWQWDARDDRLSWDEEQYRLFGVPAGTCPHVQDFFALVHPEDRDPLRRAFDATLAQGGDFTAEFRIVRPDGAVRWIASRSRVPTGAGWNHPAIVGVNFDVTERKQAEEQREFLVRELNHRTKNLLAVIQAIAHQTGLSATSVPDFLKALDGRLSALGAAQGRLSTNGCWHGASLRELLHQTLLPLGLEDGRQVRVEANDLPLASAAAQSLALAVHELATNATKHGALSVAEGHAVLTARLVAGDTGPMLEIVWREEGGPPVRPPTRRGFGTALLTRVIMRQHRGRVQLDWQPTGLLCRLVLPAGQVLEAGHAALAGTNGPCAERSS